MTTHKTDTARAALLDAAFLALCGVTLLAGILVFQGGGTGGIRRGYAADIVIAVELTLEKTAAFVQEIVHRRAGGAAAATGFPGTGAVTGGFLGEAEAAADAVAAVEGDVAAAVEIPSFDAAASRLAEINAAARRGIIVDDRLEGLLLRLEAGIYYNRLEDARDIALSIETFAQKQTDGRYNTYLYLARAVSRLVESQNVSTINTLKEEFAQLKAENEYYRRSLLDTETRNSLTDSALSLQDSNMQIQELLLQTLREDYQKAREELTLTRSYLDSGETLATLEAKEKTREGYAEGINEARVLLEQSLRIRSRDGRVEFLKQARTRWMRDIVMVRLIDTLLERL